MKDYRRLRVGAVLANSPSGIVSMELVPFDGGVFNLTPKKTDTSLVLVDPNRPSGYGVEIGGEPEVLRQFANALLAVARSQSDGDPDSDPDGDA